MRMELHQMTPEAADEFLDRSERFAERGEHVNRRISRTRVAALVDAIRRDQWKLTHQAIAIDDRGVIIDGQHRLSAIRQAGISVPLWVATGVPRDSFDVLDLRGTRTTGDTLRIAGYTNVNVLAAVTRMVLVHAQTVGTTVRSSSSIRRFITTTDVLDFVRAHGPDLQSAIAAASGAAHGMGRGGATVPLATAIYVIRSTGASVDLVSAYVEALQLGAMLPVDSPLYAFRRWVAGDSGYVVAGSERSMITAWLAVKVWNAWIAGERWSGAARFRPAYEQVPEPLRGASEILEAREAELAAAGR